MMPHAILTLEPALLDEAALHDWPLPQPDASGDKESRGHVLVVGGSVQMPGAVVLAATAALRAGAGKLTVATTAPAAPMAAAMLPEARVIALPETQQGGLAPEGAAALNDLLPRVDALLIGPGMQDEAAAAALVNAVLPALGTLPLVLDATAMAGWTWQPPREGNVLLTPHAGELAHLTELDKAEVLKDPLGAVRTAAARWGATVVLKGAVTHIARPDGRIWRHQGGNAGLGVSGSGDVLAGVIAGLAARGATLEQAAAWGVAMHAQAGEALAARIGPLGYLAREIADEIPRRLARHCP
ncbi:NAD(P)H-hydrate dehydratase [Chitiniphilus purpureus]|uniref:ADP-dependent (S)-NAD(P)H-hydrate dehydratase n=1 Tax=Chitiniphilus purpureus TaxID=2981137 RepID=A0ABY6DRN5_9NEIS|nr:NAD(P)H-hydrate dehydratase [Chitiniphilus sp. CD1]UXY17040.1 NAD(P)H-hydrate dehydratase [Chitiniphilus sp. CD1]